MKNKLLVLPDLAYGYDELAPHMSAEQLKIHHQKHHQSYVTVANAIWKNLTKRAKLSRRWITSQS